MTGYWKTPDRPAGDAVAGPEGPTWVHVPDPTYSERHDDITHTQLSGPHKLYTWLRFGDGPDAVELAATEGGIAIRHGGARFGSVALTFPADEFEVFANATDTTPGGPLAELIATAREMEKEEATRPRPPSLMEPSAPDDTAKILAWLDWKDQRRRRRQPGDDDTAGTPTPDTT